jgi:hypothetical protein
MSSCTAQSEFQPLKTARRLKLANTRDNHWTRSWANSIHGHPLELSVWTLFSFFVHLPRSITPRGFNTKCLLVLFSRQSENNVFSSFLLSNTCSFLTWNTDLYTHGRPEMYCTYTKFLCTYGKLRLAYSTTSVTVFSAQRPQTVLFRLSTPRPTPNLEYQASVFMTPGDRVTQLYPQTLGTHFSRLVRHAWVTVGLFLSSVVSHTSKINYILILHCQTSLICTPNPGVFNLWY